MILPETHKKCRSRQSNQIRDLFYLSSSFSVHLLLQVSWISRCLVCAPELLPVSIIQFSSAARINQSSLRCLLFANNFSLLLSNSFELFYWRWNFCSVFLVSCLSLRITLSSVRRVEYGCCLSMPLLRPASIRIMLISVSSFKIIQINCGIYLGSFFPRALALSHAETHKELNSRATD